MDSYEKNEKWITSIPYRKFGWAKDKTLPVRQTMFYVFLTYILFSEKKVVMVHSRKGVTTPVSGVYLKIKRFS